MKRRPWWGLLSVLLTTLTWTSRASAQHVALVLFSKGSPVTQQAAARLRGELSASGFTVREQQVAPAAQPRDALAQGARDQPDASVLVFVRSSPEELEAWLSERLLGPVTHSRIAVDAGESDALRRFAVQVSDILRGRVAEAALGSETPPPRTEAVAQAAPRASRRRRQLSLAPSAGVLLLWRPHLWDLSAMPLLSAALMSRSPERRRVALGAALTVAGYGSSTARESQEGRVEARHGLGLAEALLRSEWRSFVQCELGLGMGVYGVGAQGRARAPYRGHEVSSFSPLLSSRVAVDASLTRRWSLRLSGHALFAPRKTSLQVTDEQLARAGGAMLAASLETRVWF